MHGLSSDEWTSLLLSVNTHRAARRLSPYQVGLHIARALQNIDIATLARDLGFADTTMLSKLHRLATLPNGLASVVSWGNGPGSVSMSAAAELLRLGTLAAEGLTLAAANNITKEEARQIIQLHQRSGQSLGECFHQSLLTRPRIERVELILGSLLSTSAKQNAEALGNEAATKILCRRLAKAYPDVLFKSVRINADRFSLMLDEAAAVAFRQLIGSTQVESTIDALMSQNLTPP